ncbi:MAG: toll/interleukin-1 receptor domain-containing protein, partial [Planctomycetaceae bacterium]
MTGEHYDVFLSYSSRDHVIVSGERGLAEQLGQLGVKCFVDRRNLHLGQNWVDALESALASSHAVA